MTLVQVQLIVKSGLPKPDNVVVGQKQYLVKSVTMAIIQNILWSIRLLHWQTTKSIICIFIHKVSFCFVVSNNLCLSRNKKSLITIWSLQWSFHRWPCLPPNPPDHPLSPPMSPQHCLHLIIHKAVGYADHQTLRTSMCRSSNSWITAGHILPFVC